MAADVYWQIQFEVPAEHSVSGNAYWDTYPDRYSNEADARTMLESMNDKWRQRIIKVTVEVCEPCLYQIVQEDQ